MSWEHVLLDKKDHIGWVTLNRPDKLNAFGGRMRQEIAEIIDDVCADPEVRVIVITGAGKAFCVGGDVTEFVSGETKALAETSSTERPAMSKIVLALNRVEKPVIAAVNGVAAGGGVNLALACELIFSGDVIDAGEAFEIGMVNKIVPHEQLMDVTGRMAKRIAGNAPIPIAFAKRGLQNFYQWDLAQALDYESFVLGVTMKTDDIKEGFTAFLEKREPQFKGR